MVASFETEEIPRIPAGTLPFREPFRLTEGTSLFRSEMSLAFERDSCSFETTAAETGTSLKRSGRFCAVITISSSVAGCAETDGLSWAQSPSAAQAIEIPARPATARFTIAIPPMTGMER
jgi:hypothetical protein